MPVRQYNTAYSAMDDHEHTRFYFKILFIYFSERGEGREKEGGKHPCVREAQISCLSHTPPLGTSRQQRHVP